MTQLGEMIYEGQFLALYSFILIDVTILIMEGHFMNTFVKKNIMSH